MATIVPPPQKQTGNILDFLLQMSSLEERKEYRKVQERHVSVVEEQLGLVKKEWKVGKPARKEEALVSKSRRKTLEGLMLTEKQLAISRRTLATSIAYGDKDAADASRFMIQKLEKVKKASPIALETILFADELSKDSRAQLAIAQQQVFGQKQAMELMQMQHDTEKQYRGSMYDAIMKNLTASNIESGTAAMGAIRGDDPEMFSKMIASMKATAAKTKMEPEERKFRASEMFVNVVEQFGTGTWQEMLTAEVANLPYPDVRHVYKDAQWPRSNWNKILTRGEAKTLGAEEQWLESTAIDLEKVQERTQPKSAKPFKGAGAGMTSTYTPKKKKTVKELADERAKKAKKSTATKSPYSQYPDAFLENGIWKVIKDGVKYRIED